MTRDLAALVGLALIFLGCWWVYPPAALIVAGGLILGGAIWGHTNDAAESSARGAEEAGEVDRHGQ